MKACNIPSRPLDLSVWDLRVDRMQNRVVVMQPRQVDQGMVLYRTVSGYCIGQAVDDGNDVFVELMATEIWWCMASHWRSFLSRQVHGILRIQASAGHAGI